MEVFQRAIFLLLFSILFSSCASNDQGGSFTTNTSSVCTNAQVKGQYIVNWKDGSQSVVHAMTDKEFIDGFLKDNKDDVLFAEPDYRIYTQDVQNDDVHSFSDPEPNWGVYRIHADAVWTSNFKGAGIKVAVVDSGVDINHKQLINQVSANLAELNGRPGVDDDGNGLVDDIYGWNFKNNTKNIYDDSGHGTHVSGIILAEHGKGSTLGVAPEAKLIPIDFMDRAGGTTSAAIAAINYAVSRGANIINASWGSYSCSQSLNKTFADLQTANVLLVVASGNSGNDISYYPEFPAAFHTTNQINVAALDPSGYMASFSNFGLLVDILAPGVFIESTVPTALEPTGYGVMSGTSMAAPFVSGAAALIWSKRPSATAIEVKNALLNSLENLSSENKPRGKLRVDQALNAL